MLRSFIITLVVCTQKISSLEICGFALLRAISADRQSGFPVDLVDVETRFGRSGWCQLFLLASSGRAFPASLVDGVAAV